MMISDNMARSKRYTSSIIVVLFISCIVLYIIISYNDDGGVISKHDENSIFLRHRSLGVSDFNDPKSTIARIEELSSTPTTTSIQFYIKSSGKPTYLSRSRRIANSWAKDTNNQITFLFDTDNNSGVLRFQEQYPYITIRQVDGTLRQGEYKGGGDANAAYHAQRIKTRAVFTDFDTTFFNNNKNNKPVPDWVCYLDDDMSVHVSNLMEDLEQRKPSCTPNCWIGDTYHDWFAAGGWCMERELANKVKDLLKLKTDEEIGWDGTDDGGFSKSVMRGVNGIQPSVSIIDSNRWFSEFHRPMCSEQENCTVTGYKKINQRISWKNPWTKNRAFMDEWYPNVAVYFNVYGMRSFHSRKPYVVGSGPKRAYRHSYYKSAK